MCRRQNKAIGRIFVYPWEQLRLVCDLQCYRLASHSMVIQGLPDPVWRNKSALGESGSVSEVKVRWPDGQETSHTLEGDNRRVELEEL